MRCRRPTGLPLLLVARWTLARAGSVPGRRPSLELVHPDGSGLRTLATKALSAAEPVFSPDGSRIAFAANDGIWTVGVDGGSPDRIATVEGRDLAWSPDGTQVAFTTWPQLGVGVEIARTDGGGLIRAQVARSSKPSWSPDGRLAYFARGTACRASGSSRSGARRSATRSARARRCRSGRTTAPASTSTSRTPSSASTSANGAGRRRSR